MWVPSKVKLTLSRCNVCRLSNNMFRIPGRPFPNGSQQVFKMWPTYTSYCKNMPDSFYLPGLINYFLVDRKKNSFEVKKHTRLKKSTQFPCFIFIYNTHFISDRHSKGKIYTWYFKINYTFSGARAHRWSIYHFWGLATVFEAVKVCYSHFFFFTSYSLLWYSLILWHSPDI